VDSANFENNRATLSKYVARCNMSHVARSRAQECNVRLWPTLRYRVSTNQLVFGHTTTAAVELAFSQSGLFFLPVTVSCISWVVRYWRGYLSAARCKWIAYDPADATATPLSIASLNSGWFNLSCAGFDPVTRLKLSVGPIRGPYSLYRAMSEHRCFPKVLIQCISNDITEINLKMTMGHWKGNESWMKIRNYY